MMHSGNGVLDAVLSDEAGLRSVLREAIGADHAAVADWRWQQLPGGAGAGTRLFRVSGSADTKGHHVPWTTIIKVLTREIHSFESSSTDQASWDYWKREWHVYRSSWQAALPGPVVPPACYGTGEGRLEDDDEVLAWIAMEDLGHINHQHWPRDQWPTVARQIGVFNGRYLSGQPLPAEPWLATNWLRGWSERSTPLIPDLEQASSHPVSGRVFTRTTVSELMWLWENRNQLYGLLEELPRTFCHNDLYHRNLSVRGDNQPECVAIDWALCGDGVIGQELSALIGATLIFRGSRPEDWDQLEEVCLAAYTHGLRDIGPDQTQARLGYLITVALRFGLGSLPPLIALTRDDQDPDLIRRLFECSYDEWIVHTARAMEFFTEKIRQLREMLGSPTA
jgi:Phosphotransferase enzyme family